MKYRGKEKERTGVKV